MPTIDEAIGGYLKLREAKEKLVRSQKEQLAPINEAMYKLQLFVQQQLQEQGQTNTRTTSGSAFLQTDTSVTADDFQATLAWIREKDMWAMLEQRVSKSVVVDYVETTQEIPPGIKIKSEISCHIRK